MANDTHANILLNLLIREYGCLPDEYRIVGFDDSPIASEAIVPITTIEQQIDKIAYEAMNLLVSQMNERKKKLPWNIISITVALLMIIPGQPLLIISAYTDQNQPPSLTYVRPELISSQIHRQQLYLLFAAIAEQLPAYQLPVRLLLHMYNLW